MAATEQGLRARLKQLASDDRLGRRTLLQSLGVLPLTCAAGESEPAPQAGSSREAGGTPAQLVNTLIGTAPPDDPEFLGNNPPKGEELYYGSVVPGATALDGTVKLGPDTGFDGIFHVRGSSYRYTDPSIMGFSHTHHEYNRFANVLFMPSIGPIKTVPGSRENPSEGYRSRKDASRERGTAGYYTVFLTDHGIQVELTATKNAGMHRYIFPRSEQAHLLIDLASAANSTPVQEAHVEIPDNRHVVGWERCKGNITVYFHAEFNKPFKSFGTWQNGQVQPGSGSQTGRPIGAYLDFATSSGEAILVKVGISFAGADAARQNSSEIPGWDFDGVRKEAEAGWNAVLRRVEVEGGTEAERVNFYTSLYRAMASDNFGWPNGGAVQTLVRPEWVSQRLAHNRWDYTRGGFWGPQMAPWVMGAYTRGIRGFDVAAAYESLRKSATEPARGWERLADYMRLGYIPTEEPGASQPTADSVPGRPDVVNRTLGYAYEDFCIAQLALALGRRSDYEFFLMRSGSYRMLYDPTTGFMRARRHDGSWVAPFDPSMPYGQRFYREGTAWHYLWLVPHDVQGLIGLMGGAKPFVEKLDEFFTNRYNPKEPMRDLTGMIGQYTHGNEHDRHAPYLYSYAGAPWKTQQIVRKIMRLLHKPTPGGLCGMDDNGYLTGWYVFSALGFYPVEPALGAYVIGSPVFRKATLALGTGRFVVEARDASDENIYIQSATLNGKPLDRPWFRHSELMADGRLVLQMGPSPQKQWGAAPSAAPPSVTPALPGAPA
jgi:putative alpha-1,2-mannosidase